MSPLAAPVGWVGEDTTPYGRFYEQVRSRQLAAWLPAEPSLVLDISGGRGTTSALAAAAGHQVLSVLAERPTEPVAAPEGPAPCPRQLATVADVQRLGWLRSSSVDAVVAEGRVLSSCLATEETLADLARVLRPGGRLLLCVDSLVLGLALLAEQGRWAELADVPSADVVLVPTDDGGATRCFWPEEVEGCLRGAGLEVEWVRPRTVLSRDAVERALRGDPGALPTLVATEVRLSVERAGETIGSHLVASARRPA